MGEVYRASHTRSNALAAVKIVHAHLAEDDDFIKRFLREAKLSAAANSPHIVSVLDTGEAEGGPYIAMELLSGIDLSGYLSSASAQGTLSLEHLQCLARQVGEGLMERRQAAGGGADGLKVPLGVRVEVGGRGHPQRLLMPLKPGVQDYGSLRATLADACAIREEKAGAGTGRAKRLRVALTSVEHRLQLQLGEDAGFTHAARYRRDVHNRRRPHRCKKRRLDDVALVALGRHPR